ncbi:hypothetical protein PR048_014140 [Dryococelus australis]|uniref:Uncharacterized protein n=1 Tax=Dryococelus australis TaxID=614101 RepID=A0ABQ9HE55_9NEOP|nr:hypothetical protein PR048_014140 [Dryococelus australis]
MYPCLQQNVLSVEGANTVRHIPRKLKVILPETRKAVEHTVFDILMKADTCYYERPAGNFRFGYQHPYSADINNIVPHRSPTLFESTSFPQPDFNQLHHDQQPLSPLRLLVHLFKPRRTLQLYDLKTLDILVKYLYCPLMACDLMSSIGSEPARFLNSSVHHQRRVFFFLPLCFNTRHCDQSLSLERTDQSVRRLLANLSYLYGSRKVRSGTENPRTVRERFAAGQRTHEQFAKGSQRDREPTNSSRKVRSGTENPRTVRERFAAGQRTHEQFAKGSQRDREPTNSSRAVSATVRFMRPEKIASLAKMKYGRTLANICLETNLPDSGDNREHSTESAHNTRIQRSDLFGTGSIGVRQVHPWADEPAGLPMIDGLPCQRRPPHTETDSVRLRGRYNLTKSPEQSKGLESSPAECGELLQVTIVLPRETECIPTTHKRAAMDPLHASYTSSNRVNASLPCNSSPHATGPHTRDDVVVRVRVSLYQPAIVSQLFGISHEVERLGGTPGACRNTRGTRLRTSLSILAGLMSIETAEVGVIEINTYFAEVQSRPGLSPRKEPAEKTNCSQVPSIVPLPLFSSRFFTAFFPLQRSAKYFRQPHEATTESRAKEILSLGEENASQKPKGSAYRPVMSYRVSRLILSRGPIAGLEARAKQRPQSCLQRIAIVRSDCIFVRMRRRNGLEAKLDHGFMEDGSNREWNVSGISAPVPSCGPSGSGKMSGYPRTTLYPLFPLPPARRVSQPQTTQPPLGVDVVTSLSAHAPLRETVTSASREEGNSPLTVRDQVHASLTLNLFGGNIRGKLTTFENPGADSYPPSWIEGIFASTKRCLVHCPRRLVRLSQRPVVGCWRNCSCSSGDASEVSFSLTRSVRVKRISWSHNNPTNTTRQTDMTPTRRKEEIESTFLGVSGPLFIRTDVTVTLLFSDYSNFVVSGLSCRGRRAVRLIESQLSEQGSLSGRVTPGCSHVRIVPDDAADRWVFLGDLPFPPPLHSGAAPFSPHFTFIGSSSNQPAMSKHDETRWSGGYELVLGLLLESQTSVGWEEDFNAARRRSTPHFLPHCNSDELLSHLTTLHEFLRLATNDMSSMSTLLQVDNNLPENFFCTRVLFFLNQFEQGRLHTRTTNLNRTEYRGPSQRCSGIVLPARLLSPLQLESQLLPHTWQLWHSQGVSLLSAIGSEACRAGLINCDPIAKGGNSAHLARSSDEALGVRVSVASIAPSLLDLGHAAT